ncbi:MAG: ABC-2 transporter permease [Oscillospiraceae bacterium]|nr:ABC-2 transporter permease [Oscillospiraceae bacterium]
MKALLYLEYILTGGKKLYGIILGIGLLTTVLPPACLMFYILAGTLLLTLAPQLMSLQRLKGHFDRYALTLPYSRFETVAARYLFYLAAAVCFTVWITVLFALFFLFHPDSALNGYLFVVLYLAAHLFGGIAIILPLTFLAERISMGWPLSLSYFIIYAGFLRTVIMSFFINPFADGAVIFFPEEKMLVTLGPPFLLLISWLLSRAFYCCGFKRKKVTE